MTRGPAAWVETQPGGRGRTSSEQVAVPLHLPNLWVLGQNSLVFELLTESFLWPEKSAGFYQSSDERSLNPSAPNPWPRPQTPLPSAGFRVCGSALGQGALWCRPTGGQARRQVLGFRILNSQRLGSGSIITSLLALVLAPGRVCRSGHAGLLLGSL